MHIFAIALFSTVVTLCSCACRDTHHWCRDWYRKGECRRNPAYMLSRCPKSCGRCSGSSCRDYGAHCPYWARTGECSKRPAYMLPYCPKACGRCGGPRPTAPPPGTTQAPGPGPTSKPGPGPTTGPGSHSCGRVRAVPSGVRQKYGLSSFYTKYTEAYGIPVISSSSVNDGALKRACYDTRFLFADNADIRKGYTRYKGRIAVIGAGEGVLHIPEYAFLRSSGFDWNARARGLGATKAVPVSSAGEENLLCSTSDRYSQQDIGIHEFAHGLHLLGAVSAIPAFDSRLQTAYRTAMSRSLWRSTYSATDHKEYFAEGVSIYFGVNKCSPGGPDGVHNNICSRAALKNYDSTLYALVEEVFPCNNPLIKRCQKDRAAEQAQRLKTLVNGKCVPM